MKAIDLRLRAFFRVRAGRHSQSPLAAFRDFGAKATPALLATVLFLGAAARPTASPSAPKESPSLVLLPGSRIWLEGNSTLHPYSSAATKVALTSEVLTPENVSSPTDEAFIGALRKGSVKKLEVAIAVNGLKSGESDLDTNMYKALKVNQYPVIRFELLNYELVSQPAPVFLSVKARGKLSLAGEEKTVDLQGEVGSAKGGLGIRGSKELLMTDFGIRPPTMFFGTLKTDNKVVVRFEIFLGLK